MFINSWMKYQHPLPVAENERKSIPRPFSILCCSSQNIASLEVGSCCCFYCVSAIGCLFNAQSLQCVCGRKTSHQVRIALRHICLRSIVLSHLFHCSCVLFVGLRMLQPSSTNPKSSIHTFTHSYRTSQLFYWETGSKWLQQRTPQQPVNEARIVPRG